MAQSTKADRSAPLTFQSVPKPKGATANAHTVQFGRIRPPQQQLLTCSSDEWEDFTHEWAHSLEGHYAEVQRVAGSGDMGIDVAGFVDANRLRGIWDCFQCKHHAGPLVPSVACVDIAKVLWHSFNDEYVAPRKYDFVAPKGCGPTLTKLLADAPALQTHMTANWASFSEKITDTKTVLLDGTFSDFVRDFDFSIFGQRSPLQLIDDHRRTPYHAARFGGGLPDRPKTSAPAYSPEEGASRYIQQLVEAYEDRTAGTVKDLAGVAASPDLNEHFHRQRESFYEAEALRNFARDNVPEGTFEDLQTEVYSGVVEVERATHDDGLTRLNAVTQTAQALQLTSNALISVVRPNDRKGICHQLANDNRLRWRRK